MAPRVSHRHLAWVIALVIVVLVVLPVAQLAVSPAPPPTDYRFGVAESVVDLPLAADIRVGWSRVPLFWNGLEPAPNVYRLIYTSYDQRFLTAATEGEALVGVVEGIPRWARADPAAGPDSIPKGLDLPWNNPGNSWGQFMFWLARHYAGLINVFVIGDEISIPQGPHKTWAGSIPQFARLIEVAYQAARAANPSARILTPGAPYWYTRGRTTAALLTALGQLPGARAHHDYIDGIDLNLYNTVIFNRMIYGRYQAILRAAGLSQLPIWLTETNVAPRTRRNPTGADPVQQAAFIIENLASSLAYVTREETYKAKDGRDPTRFLYGMATKRGRPRLEVVAYRTLIAMLAGATWRSQDLWTVYHHRLVLAPVAVVTLGAPRRLIQVVWDQTFRPATVTLKAWASTATVVNLRGQATTVPATDGHFVLPLPPATYHHPPSALPTIGGLPYFVVQSVGLGQHGTPRQWNFGSPSGLPVVARNRWSRRTTHWPRVRGIRVFVNTAGDQVVIDDHGRVTWITDAGPGPTQLNTPVQALVGPNGTVFVANQGNDDILEYNAQGRLLRYFGGYGQLLGVSGIAVNRRGDVYITDTGDRVVVEYTAQGHYLRSFGGYGSRPGRLNGPDGIVLAPGGTVWVADTLNQRIEAFSPTGRVLAIVPVAGDPTRLQWAGHHRLRVYLALLDTWRLIRVPRR
jgi:hypothetical protein